MKVRGDGGRYVRNLPREKCLHCKLHYPRDPRGKYCSRGCFTAAQKGPQPWRILKPAHEASRRRWDRRIVSVIREKLAEKASGMHEFLVGSAFNGTEFCYRCGEEKGKCGAMVPMEWAVKVALAARKGGYKAGWACRRSRRV